LVQALAKLYTDSNRGSIIPNLGLKVSHCKRSLWKRLYIGLLVQILLKDIIYHRQDSIPARMSHIKGYHC
jgi:hypothetical protein